MAFAFAGTTSVYSQGDESMKLDATMDAALDVLYLDAYAEYTYEQRHEEVRSILEQNYDLMVIIRRALARNWNLMNAEEQVQVTALIEQLIVKVYIEGMEGHERPSIVTGDVVEITSKRLEIPVVVSFPGGKTYNVLYRLGRLKSGWQIYDIVGEDISMVSNYRQQFDDHFRKGSGQQLIEKLEGLLKEGELNGTPEI
jgi:phospholipid transport system substrate-binding protein